MSAKNEFIEIFTSNVKREGSDRLLDYLTNSDFFTAPASAKFHMAEIGGLCQHSVNVYRRLLKLIKSDFGENYAATYSDETIAIVGKETLFQSGRKIPLRSRRKIGVHRFAVHQTYCRRSNVNKLAHGRF